MLSFSSLWSSVEVWLGEPFASKILFIFSESTAFVPHKPDTGTEVQICKGILASSCQQVRLRDLAFPVWYFALLLVEFSFC